MLFSTIQYLAVAKPLNIALSNQLVRINYADLVVEIEQVRKKLIKANPSVLGIAMDNSPAWAVIDIAAASLNICVVPLPLFFSAEQIGHAITDAGVDMVICDEPLQFEGVLQTQSIHIEGETQQLVAGKVMTAFKLNTTANHQIPQDTAKITYTSGTTGKPKGVCLSQSLIEMVATSLLKATEAKPQDQHLSILPLSTLLENIAGLYVPLMAGATAHLYQSKQVGMSGASGFDVQKMMQLLQTTQASTLILTPELLNALVCAVELGIPAPASLRFIAVGGATVSPSLLKRADALKLPVYEGYGLSECGSVVALNTAQASKLGSVGKPLDHAKIRIAEDGEILVEGARFLTYLGANAVNNQVLSAWPTGDIGHVDAEGFLHITGRKKNMFITSYGRNVAPEWVERELTLMPAIAQAALFGEAKPFNTAVIVPRQNATSSAIQTAIDSVNASLPDYARVTRWILADTPFIAQNGQLTANYRLRREVIWQHYQQRINHIYEESSNAVL